MMKGQDVLLLLKLASLGAQGGAMPAAPDADDPYSMRGLEESTGISKSEVSAALRRCMAVGLAKAQRQSGQPGVNGKALLEFIVHGLKYVFPAQPGALARGMPTSFVAPVLKGRLMSGGEQVFVWADAQGTVSGQTVLPLFHSVPQAARRDDDLYSMLALVDAIRLGGPRESTMARKLLEPYLLWPYLRGGA